MKNNHDCINIYKNICKNYKTNHCEKASICDIKKSTDNIIFRMMVDECEGFYTVYRFLKPKCFLKMYYTPEEYNDNIEKEENLLSPCIVNGAFAAELALKIIHFKTYNNLDIKKHNLSELLYSVSEAIRNNIIKDVSNLNKTDFDTTENLIKNIGDPFVQWRYAYENLPGYGVLFSYYVEAVCEYMFKLYNIDYYSCQFLTDFQIAGN